MQSGPQAGVAGADHDQIGSLVAVERSPDRGTVVGVGPQHRQLRVGERSVGHPEPTGQELKATAVLRMVIDEASAKVRTGGPVDEPEDYELPHWAGTVPLRTVAGEAIPDERLTGGIAEPDYVAELRGERS